MVKYPWRYFAKERLFAVHDCYEEPWNHHFPLRKEFCFAKNQGCAQAAYPPGDENPIRFSPAYQAQPQE